MEELFDFTEPPIDTNSEAFQAYYRMRRIAHQLGDESLKPDGKVMTRDEVEEVLSMAPKKNAAAIDEYDTGELKG